METNKLFAAYPADKHIQLLCRSILDTDDAAAIEKGLIDFCRVHFGRSIKRLLADELSTGAGFGLELPDTREIFIKIIAPGKTQEELTAVCRLQ